MMLMYLKHLRVTLLSVASLNINQDLVLGASVEAQIEGVIVAVKVEVRAGAGAGIEGAGAVEAEVGIVFIEDVAEVGTEKGITIEEEIGVEVEVAAVAVVNITEKAIQEDNFALLCPSLKLACSYVLLIIILLANCTGSKVEEAVD